ncbi:hypothetical protein QYE76_033988 [Lolium multiflorum]|uniref:Uncharacterized protein n=1 Tax=Lolium multiflorum TaxID=4521 RepID=A0AAD8QXQ5_LOLMU|nr:hypothetical protein QYE76_033988 [Lolium multiflorum]
MTRWSRCSSACSRVRAAFLRSCSAGKTRVSPPLRIGHGLLLFLGAAFASPQISHQGGRAPLARPRRGQGRRYRRLGLRLELRSAERRTPCGRCILT